MTESRERPNAIQSLIRRERQGDEWVAFEPAGDTHIRGRGDTQYGAVIDYCERLQESQP